MATIVAFPVSGGQYKKWLLKLAISEAFSRKVVSILREARLEKKLSQNKLAEKCGLSRGAIQHIEKGIRNPTLMVAHAIATALDVPLWSVLKKVEEDGEEPALERQE